MKTLKIKPNTFYVKKQFTDDIGVIPTFPDAYVGLSATFDINSNPDTSFYLVESNTVSVDDFIYGDGQIKEMYLSLYVNNTTQSNAQTSPYLDIYSIKPNIDITEGNMVISSGSYGGNILLYNSQNVAGSWMSEDFDGTNKAFMDMPRSEKGVIGVGRANMLVITRKNLVKLAYETNRDVPKEEYKWNWGSVLNNASEELSQAWDWSKYYIGATASDIAVWGQKYTEGGAMDDEFFIQKGSDGLYRISATNTDVGDDGNAIISEGAYAKRIEPLAYPADWWIERGAFFWGTQLIGGGAQGLSQTGVDSFNQFDEDYIEKCTQFNSIFSNVLFAPDVRDIKDQTLEGPGDSSRFIAYTYANIVKSDAPSDGRALRMKAFWENYSGSVNGTEEVITANPFGFSSDASEFNEGPYGQSVSATIYGIPQPTPIDITTSGAYRRPAYNAEIEVVMKINQMDKTTFVASGTNAWNNTNGRGSLSLDRSFSIIFNDDAPVQAASGSKSQVLRYASANWIYQGLPTATSGLGRPDRFCPAITFIREDVTSQFATVYTNFAHFQAGVGSKAHLFAVTGATAAGRIPDSMDAYKTEVPIGEWFTMRIKLNPHRNVSTYLQHNPMWTNASGGASLVYFPDLTDENGQMKKALLAHGGTWGENMWGLTGSGATNGGISYSGNTGNFPNMTLWLNNMRSINVIPNAVSGNHINNSYTKVDDIINDDKTVDVLIDKISFNQWGPTTTNATISVENGMGQLTKIPAGNFMRPTLYPGDGTPATHTSSISVHPTGTGNQPPDNYYGKDSAITATYLTFGFQERTQIGNNTTNANNFLFNNYSTGVQETVDPITLVSGGYFTSGNYLGTFGHGYQNGWFDGLTVGNNTKEIQITGDANSIDNFVQKGLMKVKSSFTNWVKSGNPIIAAKIISVSDEGSTIVVDNPSLFDIPLNTPLCIELNNTNWDYKKNGSGSIGYYDVGPATKGFKNNPLVQTRKRDGNKIHLSRSVFQDDARSPSKAYGFGYNPVRNEEGAGGFSYWWNTNFNLTMATISPYAYWFNLALLNVETSADWGSSFGDVSHSGTKVLQSRAYDGIVPVTGGDTAGTTFNEFLFNDGVYANKWNISFVDSANSIVDLNTDYGYGSLAGTTNPDSVPDSDGGVGRVARDYVVSGQNYINMGSYAYVTKPAFNTPFNFLIRPTYMNLYNGLYRCNINTKDATSDESHVIYGIEDPIPEVEDFVVSPIIDVANITDPSMMSDMTKSNSTDVVFKWREQGPDINYRMLWVDESLIENKYHKANFISPLNSPDVSGNKWYSSASDYINDTNSNGFIGGIIPDIEGAQGWASKYDSNSLSTGVYTSTLGSTGEFTFNIQIKPSGGSSFLTNNRAFFFASGNSSNNTFTGYISTAGKVVIQMNTAAVTLTSTTSFACDGKQPLAIVVTYNKTLDSNNLKLYINGRLEDTKDYTADFLGATGQKVMFGISLVLNAFKGHIEEATFHTKAAYVPTNNRSFKLNTAKLADMTSGVSKSYQSRLFVYDYHNIRGPSPTQVCRSNTAAWKITGVT